MKKINAQSAIEDMAIEERERIECLRMKCLTLALKYVDRYKGQEPISEAGRYFDFICGQENNIVLKELTEEERERAYNEAKEEQSVSDPEKVLDLKRIAGDKYFCYFLFSMVVDCLAEEMDIYYSANSVKMSHHPYRLEITKDGGIKPYVHNTHWWDLDIIKHIEKMKPHLDPYWIEK